jgi:hypothetical protein
MQTYKVTVDNDKNRYWYNDKDQYHRLDGPAIEYANGYKAWYVEDKIHRLDGPARVWANGSKAWYVEDKIHRLDGPAIEDADGTKAWYVEDKLHRLDGPAVEYADGTKSWYVKGKLMSEEKFNEYIEPKPTCEGKVVEVDGIKYKLTAI